MQKTNHFIAVYAFFFFFLLTILASLVLINESRISTTRHSAQPTSAVNINNLFGGN